MYPPACEMDPALDDQHCAGWRVSPADLAALVLDLPGTAVTFDHAAIKEACADTRPTKTAIEHVGSESFARSRNPKDLLKCPVGRVQSAFVDQKGAVRITAALTRGVSDLIKAGAYSHFSLSHFANTTTPLEVAVTSYPGRPGCYVDAVIEEGEDYKDIVSQQLNTMATTEVTPLAAALATMSPENQALVAARFCEQQAQVNQAVADKVALETTAATEQDYQAARASFELLKKHMTPAQKIRFGIRDNMIGGPRENKPDRLRINDLERVLCACNAVLAAKAEPVPEAATALSTNVSGSAKRKFVEDEAQLPSGTLDKTQQDALLQQALAERFSAPAINYN